MRNFIVSFRKNVTSLGFLLCIGMTVLLLFSAEVYYDYSTQTRYSVFHTITMFSSDELANHYELCSMMIVQNARNGWFTLFVPIASAFCFIPMMCAEREQNAIRFQMFRTTRIKYHLSQFFSGVISGGLATTLGYILFAAIVLILFPNVSEMNEIEVQMLHGFEINLYELILEVWLFGSFWSIPAMFLTSVLQNKYLILCIPFFLKYGLNQTYQKIIQNAVSTDKIDNKLLDIAYLMNPDGLLWIDESNRLKIALLFGISAAVFFCIYLIINLKQGDSGA